MNRNLHRQIRCLCASSYDSGFKWGASLKQAPAGNEISLDYLAVGQTESELSPTATANIPEDAVVHKGSINDETTHELLNKYDAVFLLLDGVSCERLIQNFSNWHAQKAHVTAPIFACAYAGLVLENEAGGLASRGAADIIFTNSNADTELFLSMANGLGISPESIVHTGLPIYRGALDKFAREMGTNSPRKIVFAGQPSVPSNAADRRYLLNKLLDYCDRHTDREIWFRPRHKPDEKTFNRENYPFERLLRNIQSSRRIPPNFTLTYRPITELFYAADHCLTVSSTAAIEAMAYNCSFSTLTDFGFNQAVYGGRFFVPSGRALSLYEFLEDQFKPVSENWIIKHLSGPADPVQAIVEATKVKVAANTIHRKPQSNIPFLRAQSTTREQRATYHKKHRTLLTKEDYLALPGLPEAPLKRSLILGVANIFRTISHVPILKQVALLVQLSSMLNWIKDEKM